MATNPASGFIAKYTSLPGRALNAIAHPIDTLESALGIPLGEPQQAAPAVPAPLPPAWQAANRVAEQQSLAPDNPVPRRRAVPKKANGY